MKYFILAILLFACYDLFIVQYEINRGADIMFAGIIILLIIVFVIYSGAVIYLIKKRSLFEKSLFNSILILIPALIFLMVNIIALVTRIGDLLA